MKVSVIIPCYNVENTIGRCLESVINQTYPIYEIICVEDHSTDSTLEILKKYQGIRLIVHEENMGLGITRSDGIEAASGDYLYFIDSDDWIKSDAIAYLVENADGGDMVFGGIYSESNSGIAALKTYYQNTPFLCNTLIKKSLFSLAPHSKIRLFEDADTLPRLIYYAEKCVYAPFRLYYYTINKNGLTQSSSEIKSTIYKLLVSMHNYEFFRSKDEKILIETNFHLGILKYITILYGLAMKDIEEFNQYDKETNEILNLLTNRLLQVQCEQEQEEKEGE